MRVLVVEDEDAIAAFLRQGLREAGYAVDQAADGAEALYWLAIASYDVIVLDILLPEIDGLTVCAELRRRGVTTPVLIVQSRSSVVSHTSSLGPGPLFQYVQACPGIV